MAKPTFINSVTAGVGQGNAAVAIPLPPGVVSGNYQLVVLGLVTDSSDFGATPAGWALLTNTVTTLSTGEDYRTALYESTTATGEFTMTMTGSRVWHAARLGWSLPSGSGGRTVPIVANFSSSSSTTHAVPSIATTAPDSLVIGIGTIETISSPLAWTGTGVMVQRAYQPNLNAVEQFELIVAEIDRASPGAGSPGTFTLDSAWQAQMFALAIDGAGASPVVHTKAGGGSARMAGGGSKTVQSAAVRVKAGGGSARLAGSGVQAVVHAVTIDKLGGGSVRLAGGGSEAVQHPAVVTKLAGGSARLAGAGAAVVSSAAVVDKAGAGSIRLAGSGAHTVAQATVVDKTGSGSIRLAGAGSKLLQTSGEYTVSGGGSVRLAGAGAKTVDHPALHVKAGSGSIRLAGSGVRVVEAIEFTTYEKTGAASMRLAGGGRVLWGPPTFDVLPRAAAGVVLADLLAAGPSVLLPAPLTTGSPVELA